MRCYTNMSDKWEVTPVEYVNLHHKALRSRIQLSRTFQQRNVSVLIKSVLANPMGNFHRELEMGEEDLCLPTFPQNLLTTFNSHME